MERKQVGQVPLGMVLLASYSWFKKRRRGVEKVKDVVANGEENQSSNSNVLSRLLTNEMQFSRYWCFGGFFGLELELAVRFA